MKKIFSILLALVLVVSLGLATAAPVLAGTMLWTGTMVAVENNDYGQCDINSSILTVAENCTLAISSTAGGSVTNPGVGTFIYPVGTVVSLVVTPATGYGFVNWAGDVGTIANVNADNTTITMQGNYNITARFMAGVVAAKTELVTDGTVDAKAEADAEVVVKGTATVTVARYEDNPGGPASTGFSSLGKYIDVYVLDTAEVTELEIRLYYTADELAVADIDEETLRLFWWDGDDWAACSDSGVNTASTNGYSGYMWAKIRNDTVPPLADLQGTPFGGYGHPTSAEPGVVTKRVTDSTVDAIAEADTEVVVKGTATVTIFKYASNPHPPSGGGAPASLDLLALDTFSELGIFVDVSADDIAPGTEIEIRLYYTNAEVAAADIDEESLRLFWWDGTVWAQCSPDADDSGVNMSASTNGYSGYMWTKIRETGTTPSLSELQGTEFGGYGHPSAIPQPCGCFIATAAYGTDTAKELDILREFRDVVLLPNSLGARFVSFYYELSPHIADFISQHEILRTVVRVGFVDPVVKILNWSHDLWSVGGS